MRDLLPSTRGATPTDPAAWRDTADSLRVLQAIVMAERAIYGTVTPTTARLLAERVAEAEAAEVILHAMRGQS